MRVLQATQSPPDYIPPPTLDPGQVVCGPNYPDRNVGGRVCSLQTERGDIDFARVVARIPPEQRPELVVVRVDASKTLLPRNLGALSCRRVLVIGDTHHSAAPIGGLIDYALSEPYDLVLFDYTRQHAHFFIEAGVQGVFWLPAFNVERLAIPDRGAPDIPLSFVGNVGRIHPRRAHLLQTLREAGLPVQAVQASRTEARLLHARSQVSFNCSLNGDFNLRALEILASGGFLLTDRLGAESGLDLLFEEGRHYVGYGGVDECIEQCRRYLGDAAAATRIADQGKAAFEGLLAPERIHGDFFALLDRGATRAEFDLARDRRTGRRKRGSEMLRKHVAIYELLQAIQHARESVSMLASGRVDPSILWDAHDLARVQIALLPGASASDAADLPPLRRHDSSEGIVPPDVLLTTLEEWRAMQSVSGPAQVSPTILILSDAVTDDHLLTELARHGFQPLTGRAPAFMRFGSTRP